MSARDPRLEGLRMLARPWPAGLEGRSALANGLVTLRAAQSESGDKVMRGHAALTGVAYRVGREVDGWNETLAKNCFKRTLKESPDTVLNLDHGRSGSGLPLARTKAGTLKLWEDDKGLAFEAQLDGEDPDSVMLARKLARQDLTGEMSFCFRSTDDSFDETYENRVIRSVNLNLGDISCCVHAANPLTSSQVDDRGAVVLRRPLPDHVTAARARVQQLRRSA